MDISLMIIIFFIGLIISQLFTNDVKELRHFPLCMILFFNYLVFMVCKTYVIYDHKSKFTIGVFVLIKFDIAFQNDMTT